MAATEQLFNVRERKRFERHDIWERIAENGTISAAVMVFAAIAAVICANTDAYEAIHHFLETPLYVGLGIADEHDGVWMPGVLSRKKQVAAPIMAAC